MPRNLTIVYGAATAQALIILPGSIVAWFVGLLTGVEAVAFGVMSLAFFIAVTARVIQAALRSQAEAETATQDGTVTFLEHRRSRSQVPAWTPTGASEQRTAA